MKLTFDYYHNLDQVELRLCNPDGRELFPLPGKNRNVALRFNDLSELTFEVDSKIVLSSGVAVDLDAYDYIQTKRLIFATNIGWFQISSVDEHDNGVTKYKSVTAESLQSVLKNKGLIVEERVYCFYNPSDPYDDSYSSSDESAIPSVLGQWSKQLGIKQALTQGLNEPDKPYEEWTVTYINPRLIYAGDGGVCRTFKESVTYGYDWMANDVEDAFGVIVDFDYMNKCIHVLMPEEATPKSSVIYTFSNFMKELDVNDNAEDIVTVLNCNGDNCDITSVNPTGTNYICDFSYYMDKVTHRWMSAELIAKLEQWQADCNAKKSEYSALIQELRGQWKQHTEHQTKLQEASLILEDLKIAQNKRNVVGSGRAGALCGIITAEHVSAGRRSIKAGTSYYGAEFSGETIITAYQSSPYYDESKKRWVFSGAYKTGSANSLIAANLSDENKDNIGYWYFTDSTDGASYCKLQSSVAIDKTSESSTYYCSGFDRYIAYCFPIFNQSTGNATYTDTLQIWIDLWNGCVATHIAESKQLEKTIDSISGQLDDISSKLNIIAYFSDTPNLLRELNCYWIEGDFTNENIAVLETTTPEEELDLSNELLDTGYVELSKVSQPRFSFTIESIDATKQYEFKEQMSDLELGRIITVEKEEGVWYYPALLEISMNLDNSDEFTMQFANAVRLDDWGYTYADLIAESASTSRRVSSNWQDVISYTKDREKIKSIIQNPLDTTLRAATANATNQEFLIDATGILGRRKLTESSDEFESEQIRLTNNILIFTDDNWETSKCALGKIIYDETQPDGSSRTVSSYGLIAETIIGSLIMGERLKIRNPESTVELGAEGIVIKQADGTVVFQAKSDGSLVVRNYASQSQVTQLNSDLNSLGARIKKAESEILANTEQISLKISQQTFGQFANSVVNLEDKVAAAEAEIKINADNIKAKVSETGGTDKSFAWELKSTGFFLKANSKTVMSATASGAVFSGALSAATGTFGISLYPFTISTGSDSANSPCIYSRTGTFAGMGNLGIVADNHVYIGGDGFSYWGGSENGYDYTTSIRPSIVFCSGDASVGKNQYQAVAVRNRGIDFYYGGTTNLRCIESGKDSVSNYLVVSMRVRNGDLLIDGTITGNTSGSIISDANKKSSISDLSEKYETLFDAIRAVRYQYNYGTSGRYHTGFIAQDVLNAILSAGLETKDFAAYVETKDEDGALTCALRYEEFVALNTWQIQKLKARVTELEKIIAKLQEEGQ